MAGSSETFGKRRVVSESILEFNFDRMKQIEEDEQFSPMTISVTPAILEFIFDLLKSKSEHCKISFGGERLVVPNVMRDLILVENQISLFVLKEIFDCTLMKIEGEEIFLRLESLQKMYKYRPNFLS
ncbi:hypothetical protein HanPI659440_Chr13g0501491 [Helianthus annuus]|nr:hypothetical protein HanPI659440_Chr13g0501491 [Helianthus annuus]